MANSLLITKETGGYFTFLLTKNGVAQTPIQSIRNDLLVYGTQCHFKTGSGANIIKEQSILPTEITINASGTFTFTTVTQLWAKLIEIEFFDWLGIGGAGTGVDRFDDLLDTFTYFGKNGQAVRVNESEQKLETFTVYNHRNFTDLEDAPNTLVPNKMVVVNDEGTALELQDQPTIIPPSLTSVGSFHYVDLATITTPLTVLAGVEKKITNDTLSSETNVLNAPYGISSMWDSVNNQLDFTQCAIGDLVTVIPAIEITTSATNQTFQIYIKMGIGSATPTTKQVYNGALAVIGSIIVNPTRDFTIDTLDNKDYPAEIYILSSANATVKSGELDIRVVRKDINIVSSDPTKQDLLVSGTNIKTINSISLLGSGNIVLSGVGDELTANKQNSLAADGSGVKYPTIDAINAGVVKNFIKSNESLALAKRKDDVLYGILDQYTGEEITLSKVTGTPTVDGIIYFQLGAEYFKRNISNAYNSEWWGLSAINTSANNTTALQTCIDLVVTLDNLALLERKSIEISLPAGDIQLGNINFKGTIRLKGQGKVATRLYYNGNDYLFKGDTANISFGGICDLTMISNNALNKGFIHFINCYNMVFDNININAAVFVSQILEHSIKLESKEAWFVGASNNIYNITISNFNIKGGIGDGIHVTGDYGSAQITIRDGVLEAMDGNGLYITSTTTVNNTNIVVDNVIFQGYLGSGVVLYQTKGFDFRGYFEQNPLQPVVILGGTKFVQNVRFHNTSIGSGTTGFNGYIFKSGAGISFANRNIVFENINITAPSGSTDVLTDLAAANMKIKNITFNNAVYLNVFTPYDRESGNYEVELGYLEEMTFPFKETLYNCPIPNGMISYFRGASLINTSIRRHKIITDDVENIDQKNINTDILFTANRSTLFLGNKANYYTKKYSCYRLIYSQEAVDPMNVTVSGATINGFSSLNVLPGQSYDVVFDGTSNYEFTLVSYGDSITTKLLNLSTTPTTSASTYDILTRNTSTGVVEKVTLAASKLGTRTTNATTTGSYAVDWNAGDVWQLTLTGATTITDTNLPTGTATKVIEFLITGAFAWTPPAYWVKLPSSQTYDGAKQNHVVVTCIDGTPGSEKIYYTNELTT